MNVAERARRKLRGFLPCLGFGVAYGAGVGALFGGILITSIAVFSGGGFWTLSAPFLGGFYGALFGAIGGVLSGIVGGVLGGRLGWGLAGAVGGALACAPFLLGGAFSGGAPSTLALLLLIPAPLGAGLGVAVANGVQRRQSRLPLVPELAARLERVGAIPALPGAVPTGRGDLLPTSAPLARGDEPAPAP